MIKINLSREKQQLNISNVGGLDFTKIKIIPLVIVVICIYIPDFTITEYLKNLRIEAEENVRAQQGKLAETKTKISKLIEMKKRANDLEAQKANLGEKRKAIKEAINQKKNPLSLLLYISKNTPDEVWLSELVLKEDVLHIKGKSLDYKNIGQFINSIRSSIFAKDKETNLKTSSAVRDSDKRRLETFEVKFNIGGLGE